MGNIKAWFAKMTIVERLRLIGAVALLGLFLVAFTHSFLLRKVESIVTSFTQSTMVMEDMDMFMADLFQEKEATQAFLQFSQKSGLSKWEVFSLKNDKALDKLIEALPTQSMRESITMLKNEMEKFDSMFIQAVPNKEALGFHENEGVMGQLREAIHQVEDRLKAKSQDKLLISMLMLRRHEKDFIQRPDMSYIDLWRSEVSHFQRLLQRAKLGANDKKSIAQSFNLYVQHFEKYQEYTLHTLNLEKTLDQIYAQGMLPLLKQVHTHLSSHIDHLQATYKQVLGLQVYAFWGILLLVVLLVSLLISWIGKTITRPLNDIADAMDALEEGKIRHVHSSMQGAISELLDSLEKFQKQSVETYLLKQVLATNRPVLF